jgi:tetratricopeptide (TPR) repeat protein
MKKILLFFIGLLLTIDTFANVNFIDIAKISNDSKYVAAFNFIKDNQQYYNHWTNEWNYDITKKELIKMLRDNYATFSTIETKSTELFLLLGDLSQYLYNLDDSVSYDLAVSNYTDAIKSNPKDFRAYWFLANHYALSNVPTKAFDNFSYAQALLPTEQPADFWNDYASAMAFANMPSHCIFAMDKVKSITGIPYPSDQPILRVNH